MVSSKVVYPYLRLDAKRDLVLKAVESGEADDFSTLLNYMDANYPMSNSKSGRAVQKIDLADNVLMPLIRKGYIKFNDGKLTRTPKPYISKSDEKWKKLGEKD